MVLAILMLLSTLLLFLGSRHPRNEMRAKLLILGVTLIQVVVVVVFLLTMPFPEPD